MKANKGDRIRLIKDVSYGSVYGLIEIPKGTELTVLERMPSDDGVRTVENFAHKFGFSGMDVSFPYGIFDRYYEIIFDAEKVTNELINWIRKQMAISCGKTAVIGISGGKDSSVVAALCVEALGAENVVGVLMPNGEQSDISYSYDLVNHLGIKHYFVNIEETVKAETKILEKAMGCYLSEQAKINLPPRIRMATLYGIAQTLEGGRPINTSNLSEDWVGYASIYGDTTGSCSPLGMLITDEVIEIGKLLGLPDHLVLKKPSDGLTGKDDETAFGFTYAVLNKYIRTGICENEEIKAKIDKMNKFSRFKFQTIPMFNPKLNILAEDIANIYKEN